MPAQSHSTTTKSKPRRASKIDSLFLSTILLDKMSTRRCGVCKSVGHNKATCSRRTKPALVVEAVNALVPAFEDIKQEIAEIQASLVLEKPPAPPQLAVLPTAPQMARLDTIQEALKEVAQHLPKGLWEGAYQGALSHELSLRGVNNTVEEVIPILYKGKEVSVCRADIFIPDEISAAIELKAEYMELKEHRITQLTAYMALKRASVGVILNFNKHPKGKLLMIRVFEHEGQYYRLCEKTLQGIKIEQTPFV